MHLWTDSWECLLGGVWAAGVSLGWTLWSQLLNLRSLGTKILANNLSSVSRSWDISSLGIRRLPTLSNREETIFIRLVGNGRACLIMANLSKPNGHSSHPVGNKLPQVKCYEVLGELYELWGSPSINWSQPWKNNVMWTMEGNLWEFLTPLPQRRNCWRKERHARLSTLLVIPGTKDTLASHIFVSLWVKIIKSLLFLSLYLLCYVCNT